MSVITTPDATPTATPTAPRPTRFLRAAVVVAWPLWSAVSLTQAAVRDGFDLTRHPLSALSTGDAGWIQIANFLVAGLLLTIGAAGLPGRWVPRLVRGSGLGMAAAGVLVMDPMNGFPVGAPTGTAASLSWHAVGHMAAGTVTFALMIATSWVWARRFRRQGRTGLAVGSVLAGAALLLGDGWATTGAPFGSLTLAVGAVGSGVWISVAAVVDARR